MKIGYARISRRGRETGLTTLANQTQRLESEGCERIYTDVGSGANWEREGLDSMELALRTGDTVIVTAIDRLGRNWLGAVQRIKDWRAREIGVRILDFPVDTSDPLLFDLVLAVMSILAEWEHETIRHRTQIGVDRAKAEGRMTGKRYSYSRAQMHAVHALRAGGMSLHGVARGVGLSEQICRRILKTDASEIDAIPDHKFATGKE